MANKNRSNNARYYIFLIVCVVIVVTIDLVMAYGNMYEFEANPVGYIWKLIKNLFK